MDDSSFLEVLRQFDNAPFSKFMAVLLAPLPVNKRELLFTRTISYTIGNDGLKWISAKFYLKPFLTQVDEVLIEDEEDRWIEASIIYFPAVGKTKVIEDYSTKGTVPGMPVQHDSLEACIDAYLSQK